MNSGSSSISIVQPTSSGVTNVQLDNLELQRAMCEQWSVTKLKK